MISSSARRVACSVQPTQIIGCVNSVAYRTVATQTLSYRRSHQRRSSSSKPSSPANGPKGISEGQAVPAAPAQARQDGNKKPAARASRRKPKDVAANCTVKARDEAMQNLPSVPSTHHVKSKGMNDSIESISLAVLTFLPEIAASAFFSLYRPISVTSCFPKATSEEAFAAIFAPRTRENTRSSDVVSALSSTVNKLELAAQQERWNAEADELRVAITAESHHAEGETRHLDQSLADSQIPFPQHILSGNYRPFNPPPPPQPMTDEQMLSPETAPNGHPQHRTYKAVLTISESTNAAGEVTYMAHSSPLIADIEEPELSSSADIQDPHSPPTNFRERMNIRQERYDEFLHRRGEEDAAVWAISVKRQRKLKMKKHKYKKLMRRTRNLRRRLDRN
jgi:hypothetical protein